MLLSALEAGHNLARTAMRLCVVPQLKMLRRRNRPRLEAATTCSPAATETSPSSSPLGVLCLFGQRGDSVREGAQKLKEGTKRWHRDARAELKRRREEERGRRLAALRSSDYEVRALGGAHGAVHRESLSMLLSRRKGWGRSRRDSM